LDAVDAMALEQFFHLAQPGRLSKGRREALVEAKRPEADRGQTPKQQDGPVGQSGG